jgi:tRNA threonylcarbamoyladenosine biosynthesis protein TsaE
MPGKKICITTHSVDETRQLGRKIGALIHFPMIIALSGDLGSGKTALVQGLAQGLEVPADYYITSPTFTLINEYPGRLPLFHVDLYRLDSINDFEDIGLDELLSDQAVIVIEWSDKLEKSLLSEYLAATFEIVGEDLRRINLIAYGQNGIDLIKALEKKMITKNLLG